MKATRQSYPLALAHIGSGRGGWCAAQASPSCAAGSTTQYAAVRREQGGRAVAAAAVRSASWVVCSAVLLGDDSRFFVLLGSAPQELNTVRPEAKLTG